MKTVVGIDPGIGGAVAVLEGNDLTIWDLKPFYSDAPGFNCLDASEFAHFVDTEIDQFDDLIVVCEMPQLRRTDGIKTSRSVYRSDGVLSATFNFYGIDFVCVTARAWKKYFGLSQDKKQSVAKACKTFPTYTDFFTGPRGGQKDGRAEAALIALYASKTMK